ncbi:MAG: hypothetical protein LBQ79_05170 [Deltaproteobacteria bacterium]|jgi:large subunit ribosomal protein L22|nr:hypothetical protein [Deltaproteobacteria bacterium]
MKNAENETKKLTRKEKLAVRDELPKKDLYAVSKYLKCPSSKAVIRARTIRGLPVGVAQALLSRSPASSAQLILKVLKSAVANAVNGKQERNPDGLSVEWVQVGQAPVMKRHHPVSHGTAKKILKRFCHIAVQLRYDAPPPGGFPEGPGALRRRLNDPTGRGGAAPRSARAARAASRARQARAAADDE